MAGRERGFSRGVRVVGEKGLAVSSGIAISLRWGTVEAEGAASDRPVQASTSAANLPGEWEYKGNWDGDQEEKGIYWR